jgi:predicted dienelactone hydrolase
MRTFEILMLGALFVRWVGGSFPSIKQLRWMDFIAILAMLLTVMQLVWEKFRLQMAPAYGLVLWLFLLSISRILRGGRAPVRPSPRRVAIFAGFLLRLLIFSFIAALPILIPVFRFPAPGGPYAVGTTQLYLVDSTRPETYTPNPDDRREFMAQVWYPAQVAPGARRAPLMTHTPFQFSHLSLVQTHAYPEAPVSNAQSAYPVLIFSHGHVGFVQQNLTQMEELASRGYIVCSIAHTYHTLYTVFPDGRVVLADATLANDFLKGKSPTQAVSADHLRIWTADTRFFIDELERIQAGEKQGLLVGKLDMARLGIFGQSFGGVTAVQACVEDDRCQAGLNLDAGLPSAYVGRAQDPPLEQPFMFMSNEGRAYDVGANLAAIHNTGYGVIIRGTTHFDFTDLFLYSPVLKLTQAFGPIDGYRMIQIVNAYTVAFFDQTLKGETSPLLSGPSPDYPEVTLKIHNP